MRSFRRSNRSLGASFAGESLVGSGGNKVCVPRIPPEFQIPKEELGWEPKRDFERGLEQTIEWYLENQHWVENVITGGYQEYYEKVYGPKS